MNLQIMIDSELIGTKSYNNIFKFTLKINVFKINWIEHVHKFFFKSKLWNIQTY